MLSGTARVMKCAPAYFEKLPHLVLCIILGLHVLTGCNTRQRQEYMLEMPIFLLDDNVDDACASIYSLYEIGVKDVRGIYDARHDLFLKGKRDLDVLPPTLGAL